jgi:hypothetical protein
MGRVIGFLFDGHCTVAPKNAVLHHLTDKDILGFSLCVLVAFKLEAKLKLFLRETSPTDAWRWRM